jgi:hypothetical protein
MLAFVTELTYLAAKVHGKQLKKLYNLHEWDRPEFSSQGSFAR